MDCFVTSTKEKCTSGDTSIVVAKYRTFKKKFIFLKKKIAIRVQNFVTRPQMRF